MKRYSNQELPELAEILKNDGVISVPTDTVYGVCARAFSIQAQENLRKVKNRPLTKAFPLMCASLEQIRDIAEVTADAEKIIRAYMPGPLTVVLKKKDSVPAYVNGGMDTRAIRMASSAEIEELIERTGEPLYMTSANQSGERTCTTLDEIEESCPLLDGILEGETRFGRASTIADCTDGIRILREGPLTEDDLRKALRPLDRKALHAYLEKTDPYRKTAEDRWAPKASFPGKKKSSNVGAVYAEPAETSALQQKESFRAILDHEAESFAHMLFRMIDRQGYTDVEVYKRAGLDRRYFSKIRGGSIPRKNTVLALALAMRLNIDDTRDLLAKCGYALSDISIRDRIVRYCIEQAYYDTEEINLVLHDCGEPLLYE